MRETLRWGGLYGWFADVLVLVLFVFEARPTAGCADAGHSVALRPPAEFGENMPTVTLRVGRESDAAWFCV